jgi:thioredoxin-related protein
MTYIKVLFSVLFISQFSNIFSQEIQWLDFETAISKAETEPKPIFVDVYTDWCGWCKKMDQVTFANPKIAEYINKKYYAVKFNAESKEPVNFKGTKFSFVADGRRGYHELAAAMLQGQMSYPSIVFFDKETNLIQAVPGFQDAKMFEMIAKFFESDSYTNTSWEDFQKNFKSEIQ